MIVLQYSGHVLMLNGTKKRKSFKFTCSDRHGLSFIALSYKTDPAYTELDVVQR